MESRHETSSPIAEIELCRAWTRLTRSIPLVTTDGRTVEVIHLGTWTHGFGPDFRNAIISIDGHRAIHGSVELHLRTRGWIDHRHHLDPRYNDVELHVVCRPDDVETRRADGKLVPTVVLDATAIGEPARMPDWSRVGGDSCAEGIAIEQPELIRHILGRLGDTRMTARSARIEAKLEAQAPDAVLYGEILEALGYSANRGPMADVAGRLPWRAVASIAAASQPPDTLIAVATALLGAAGFLPLSDGEAAHTALAPDSTRQMARTWPDLALRWAISPLPATNWELARMRPNNHPIRRLVQAAALIVAFEFELSRHLLGPLRRGDDPGPLLIDAVHRTGGPAIGQERARAITTNVLIPFGFALASQSEDLELADGAGQLWESLPGAEANERTRRATRQVTGDAGLKRVGSRQQQGLIHLDQTLCAPRRCYECPIAAIVVNEHEPAAGQLG